MEQRDWENIIIGNNMCYVSRKTIKEIIQINTKEYF